MYGYHDNHYMLYIRADSHTVPCKCIVILSAKNKKVLRIDSEWGKGEFLLVYMVHD